MKTTIVFLSVIVLISAADLPSGFKVCNIRDPQVEKCLIEAIKIAINILAKGDKTLKILPLDPLEIDHIIVEDNSGATSLRQEYRNFKVYGISKNIQVAIKSIDADSYSFGAEIFAPRLEIIGNYKMNGRFLVVPLQGEGKFKINFSNISMSLNVKNEVYEKNGENYLKNKKIDFRFKKTDLAVHFENLFGGDPVLGKEINKFLNENAQDIFAEYKLIYEKAYRDAISNVATNIMQNVPLRKLFPSE